MVVNLGVQSYEKNTDKTFKNRVLRIIFGPNERIMEIMGKFEMYSLPLTKYFRVIKLTIRSTCSTQGKEKLYAVDDQET